MGLKESIASLQPLVDQLVGASDENEKLEVLNAAIQGQNRNNARKKSLANDLDVLAWALDEDKSEDATKREIAAKSVVAINQGHVVFRKHKDAGPEAMRALLDQLVQVETFYAPMGGIVGYHFKLLELILEAEGPTADKGKSRKSKDGQQPAEAAKFVKPAGIDISDDSSETRSATLAGVKQLPMMAELYAVGGAGDRLGLKDENGKGLPAAELPFGGKTLLDGLVGDVQAKEYLYFKLMGKQVTTPIAMMTSLEKDNDFHIRSICEKSDWFGRPRSSLHFFQQPMCPVVNKEGNWSLEEPLKLYMKPGGHGVIWKLCQLNKVFESFTEAGRSKMIVRQINNPIAGTDVGLLAFTGYGCDSDRSFGFYSCPRRVNAPEGMDVLKEWKEDGEFKYCVTNVEYTEFGKLGIKDAPDTEGSSFSPFPSNTNVLFADIKHVEGLTNTKPVPGMIVNLKSKAPYFDPSGKRQDINAGRLESSMQNIADYIVTGTSEELSGDDKVKKIASYVTYNDRRKTISVTKKLFVKGADVATMADTPENCHMDFLLNARVMLEGHCNVSAPEIGEAADYLTEPGFLFSYHPALGPLYEVIGQKIRGGSLGKGSEVELTIAELNLDALKVDGSLRIVANDVMGRVANGILEYSNKGGKCTMLDCTVTNRGVDYAAEDNAYWKKEITRHESMLVTIQGSGEFYADGITFNGNVTVEVKDGMKMTAFMHNDEVRFKEEKISAPTWSWDYADDETGHILLNKVTCDDQAGCSAKKGCVVC